MGDGEGVGSNWWFRDAAESGEPCWPTTRTSASRRPASGSRSGCVATRCPRSAYDVSGFAFAGLPGVVIGHNATLAWGLTDLGADVTDFFLSRSTRRHHPGWTA